MLIVDDDGLVRAFLKDCLQSLGHEVAEAKDGEEALEQLQMQPFELLFLDLLMPRMSGLDVLGRVRDLHPDCRVVVVSSLDSDSLVEQALGAGASGFITKPFHPVEVKSAVVQALRAQSEAK
jgi:two-component system chemotaxis response regulator CheY